MLWQMYSYSCFSAQKPKDQTQFPKSVISWLFGAKSKAFLFCANMIQDWKWISRGDFLVSLIHWQVFFSAFIIMPNKSPNVGDDAHNQTLSLWSYTHHVCLKNQSLLFQLKSIHTTKGHSEHALSDCKSILFVPVIPTVISNNCN